MKPLIDKARGVGDKFQAVGHAPVARRLRLTADGRRSSLFASSREPALPYAEVGICQGDLPGKPGGSYVVVIQYAY